MNNKRDRSGEALGFGVEPKFSPLIEKKQRPWRDEVI